MSEPDPDPDTGLADLTGVQLDEISELDDSVLGHSLRVLMHRLRDGRLPLDSFNASI